MTSRHAARWALSLRKLSVRLARAAGIEHDYVYRAGPGGLLRRPLAMRARGFRDQICTNLFRFGWQGYEAPIPAALALLFHRHGGVFVDIGANTGFYALLASAAGASRVHAFEPAREIHAMLLDNVRLSGAEATVEASEMALSDFSGQTDFFVPVNERTVETSASLDGSFREGSVRRTVQVGTVDGVLLERLQAAGAALVVFKIDVENCEHLVLAGMPATLASLRPLLVLELLDENPHAEGIRARLAALDYVKLDFGPLAARNAALAPDPRNKNSLFVPAEKLRQVQDSLA